MTTMSDSVFYVYEHWRTDTGVCFYVGKGKGRRAYYLCERSLHHQSVINSLKTRGFVTEVRIVEVGLTENEAFEVEKQRIAFWRAAGFNLCNKTDGGDGISGYKMTEDDRRKISHGKKGKKLSSKTCTKMSEASKNYYRSDEGKKRAIKMARVAADDPRIRELRAQKMRDQWRNTDFRTKSIAANKARHAASREARSKSC
jgi:uncharacterized protein (DUF2147 family)